jgi:hypothetical protein
VFELASTVVRRDFPQADVPVAVRSTGIDQLLLEAEGSSLAGALDQAVADLAGQVEGTIGVIAAPSRLPALARAGLASVTAHPGRVSFLSPLDAKGLEYDAVVVVGPDEIVAESPGGVRVLYVALTRPTQRLVTIDVDGPGAWRDALA